MSDLEPQRLADRLDDLGQPDRQKALAKPAGDEAVKQIGGAVQGQEPHPSEVPQQTWRCPRPQSHLT